MNPFPLPYFRSLVAAMLLWAVPALAKPPVAAPLAKGPVRLQARQAARDFTTVDVDGRPVSLASLKGRKVLLMFMRNVGCPVCNRRVHELLEQADYFRAHNLAVVAVYESSPALMKQYLAGQAVPFTMVPNPDQSLYQLYGLEVSGAKAMASVFHGVIGKASQGKKLFQQAIEPDGNRNRIGAEFLLDERGTVAVAHYHRYIGDELPLADIKKFLN
ncbi:AhpC/TSA family protein [Hymenobacter sp. BT664]|uniref:AhpC/TSA family protein n=1 Tax=Hymenobacter montanus TaxID=2771359 RepID=A0A927BB03_9BACT|nr:peroxiredoxin-like family protein [Hymenobacter montanus]MBD2767391.1 AhpC/TSA family protein [Hymenobacter montanus]